MRISSVPPGRVAAGLRFSSVETPVHADWSRAIRALHLAGLLRDLSMRDARERLGEVARVPPEPQAVMALLAGYYSGDGDPDRGLSRIRAERWVAQHPGELRSAEVVLARLMRVAPELGWIALLDRGPEPLLCDADSFISVSGAEDEEFESDSGVFVRRTVSVRALVGAVNELLAKHGVHARFLPLRAPDGVDAYAGLDPLDAAILASVDLLAEPLDALLPFAGWNEPAVARAA